MFIPAGTKAKGLVLPLSMQRIHLTRFAESHLRGRVGDLKIYRHVLLLSVKSISQINGGVGWPGICRSRQRLEVAANPGMKDFSAGNLNRHIIHVISLQQAALRQSRDCDRHVDDSISRCATELALQKVSACPRCPLFGLSLSLVPKGCSARH